MGGLLSRMPAPGRCGLAILLTGALSGALAAPDSVMLPIRVLDAEDLKPIPNALVRVEWGPYYQDALPWPECEGRTDAAGTIALSVPRRGRFTVFARAGGYEFAAMPTALSESGPEDLWIVLARGGSISGRVVSHEGEPVARARVFISAFHRTDNFASDFDWQIKYETETNADGAFVLRGIPPSDGIVLVAVKAGYAPGRSDGFEVGFQEEVTGQEIVLHPGGTIEGVVLDDASRPVPGIVVGLSYKSVGDFGPLGLKEDTDDHLPSLVTYHYPESVTDASGRFRMESVSFGSYGFTLRHPDDRTRSGNPYEPSISVKIAPDARSQKVTLNYPLSLSGVRRIARGKVIAPEGRPLAGVRVGSGLAGEPCFETDALGRFRCEVPLECETLHFAKPGYGGRACSLPKVPLGPSEEVTIVLAPLAILTIHLGGDGERLDGGGAVLDGRQRYAPFLVGGSILGSCDCADSEMVHECSYRLPEIVARDPRGIYACLVESGKASLGIRLADHGPIDVKCDLAAGVETRLDLGLRTGRTIRGRIVDRVTGREIPGAEVVLSWRGGIPRFLLPEVERGYWMRVNIDEGQTRTDRNGAFLIRNAPDESLMWRIWAVAPGFAAGWTRLFRMTAGALAREVVLSLEPQATIRGRVISPGLGSRMINASSPEVHFEWDSRTWLQGSIGVRRDETFLLDRLPPGNYLLFLSSFPGEWGGGSGDDPIAEETSFQDVLWCRRVTLAAGEERILEIDPKDNRAGRFRVLLGDQPITSAKAIHLTPGRGSHHSEAEADSDGIFHFPRKHARFAIFVDSGKGWESWIETGVVPSDPREAPADIHLGTCTIEGKIRFADAGQEALDPDSSQPRLRLSHSVADAWSIEAVPVGRLPGGPSVPREGWFVGGYTIHPEVATDFRISGLPPGRYVLRARGCPPLHSTPSGIVEVAQGETRRGIELDVEVDRRQAATVEIRVVGRDGKPAPSQIVSLEYPFQTYDQTDDRGLAQFHSLPHGHYIAIVDPNEDEEDAPVTFFEFDAPAQGTIEVRLGSPAKILVTVTDELDRPAGGACLSLYGPSGVDFFEVTETRPDRSTDSTGKLWIHGISPGTYELEASYGKRRSPIQRMRLDEGDERQLRVRLEP